MSTLWDNLPNAKHIDLVLEHIKKNINKWVEVRFSPWPTLIGVRAAARRTVRMGALASAWDAAWDAAMDASWDAGLSSIRDASTDAILALIVYDDCAHLLYSDPDEVEILAKLGVPAAVLILPACIAISETEEKNAKPVG